jgi:uncharacterized protein (DUF169 family)
MNYSEVVEQLSSQLALDTPPIAVSFVETAPAEVQVFDQEVPSACTFWQRAESGVFYAAAEKHFNCPIGAMTLGFTMPDSVQQQLAGVVEKMTGCGYIAAEEPERIPFVRRSKTGIVYGPLRDFPIDPDLVLMWLTPAQTMLYGEAVGMCHWTETAPKTLFGRPSCAALPMALEQSQSALSLGCMGMRTFTEISEDRLLAVLPGDKVQAFVNALDSTLMANQTMRTFYEEHKAAFIG